MSELSGGGGGEEDGDRRNGTKPDHPEESKKSSDLKDLKDLVRYYNNHLCGYLKSITSIMK